MLAAERSSPGEHPQPDWRQWSEQLIRVGILALATFWVATVGWMVIAGPPLHAGAQHQIALDAESQAICQLLGMSAGGDRYSACAAELSRVRQEQEDRIAMRSGGVL